MILPIFKKMGIKFENNTNRMLQTEDLIENKIRGVRVNKNKKDTALKILIVEDDLLWQMFLIKCLKSICKDVSLKVCTSVEVSKNLISQQVFDVIVADHKLEGMDTGLDLWNHIYSLRNAMNFPVFILITGQAEFYSKKLNDGIFNLPSFVSKINSSSKIKSDFNKIISSCA